MQHKHRRTVTSFFASPFVEKRRRSSSPSPTRAQASTRPSCRASSNRSSPRRRATKALGSASRSHRTSWSSTAEPSAWSHVSAKEPASRSVFPERKRSAPPPDCSGDAFEETGGAHASANAHRDDAPLLVPAPELVEQRGGELRARAAEGMAERDRAAVHVDLVVRDAELALAINGLARERFVDLEKIDVFDLHSILREQLLDRRIRTDAHDRGIDADRDVGAEIAEALQPKRLRGGFAHYERSGSAIRKRRAVARGDGALRA